MNQLASVVNSFFISGIEGALAHIETETLFGKPMVSIVGLGDLAIREAKDRLEAAIIRSDFDFPKMKIVINLSPCDIKKSGSHFDLPMAIGLLLQSKQITIDAIDTFAFIGELSLNGELRGCTGVLPMVICAKEMGVNNIILPISNLREAELVEGINAFGFRNLKDVTDYVQKIKPYEPIPKTDYSSVKKDHTLDFIDVKGQDSTIQFITLAAAGGHNFLMIGSPGCGKSMIAKRIPSILPSMTHEESLEVTKIYSVSGLLRNKGNLVEERPFRTPHHNASLNSLIGGGLNATPGEVSLAHNGVLFLDEFGEFAKKTLDALRQPIEDGIVTISRVRKTNTYPARIMLVSAMNPCPCGYYGESKCRCSDYEILKYRDRISGPIMDRIDIQKRVNPVSFTDITEAKGGVSSEKIRSLVE
ncbi:MAG: YifB family Mg chelatase-like AAA ATPase, partial [Clostridium sp.]